MPNIKIRIEKGEETAGDGQELQEKSNKKKEDKFNAAITLVAHQALNDAKKVLNYSVNNIGNFTGDYTKTESIQEIISGVGDIASVAVGFAASPVAGIIAISGVVLSKTFETISYFQDQKHKQIEQEFLLERSGNSLLNGSRGTEN